MQEQTAGPQCPTPCARVFLSIKASKLKDRDFLSKSDPICVVLQQGKRSDGSEKWVKLGRTEVVWNSLNPEFARKIKCDYFFEQRQKIKFELYDVDNAYGDVSKHDFLGSMECYLAEIVSVPSFKKELGGLSGKCGWITVSAEEISEGADGDAEFHLRAENLARSGFFGFTDPFLKIYRILDDNGHFVIECWDHAFNGSHRFIGECSISVNDIIAQRAIPVPLLNEKHKSRCKLCYGTYKNSGTLQFLHFKIARRHSFLEYIQGGTQLDFSVAIDMTKSNGDPSRSTSLHFIGDQGKPSQYELAIRAVVDICQFYSRTQLFNAFGFGAIVPGQRKASPVFHLTLSSQCEVHGLQGVLDAYHSCLSAVRLYGPTNFAPVITEAARRAAEVRDGSRYQILLIITDGAISDMSHTKQAIIDASYLPLSIIIVGVGSANFGSMNELDSDDLLLTFDGRTAQRDIVQFVALRDFRGDNGEPAAEELMSMLAAEVLAEVPQQLTSYMVLNGIVPTETVQGPLLDLPPSYGSPKLPNSEAIDPSV